MTDADIETDTEAGAGAGAVTVRLARPGDVPALRRLDPWPSEARWRHKIAGDEVAVLAAGANGPDGAERVAGLTRWTYLWTTVPFLGLIEIEPELRGRGHSRRLLGFVVEHLRRAGYAALLSSSQTDEPAPQAWHRHLGFRPGGILEDIADDGVGEVVFRLELERWR